VVAKLGSDACGLVSLVTEVGDDEAAGVSVCAPHFSGSRLDAVVIAVPKGVVASGASAVMILETAWNKMQLWLHGRSFIDYD